MLNAERGVMNAERSMMNDERRMLNDECRMMNAELKAARPSSFVALNCFGLSLVTRHS